MSTFSETQIGRKTRTWSTLLFYRIYVFRMILTLNCDYFRTHRLVFVMKTDCVFCQAGTQSVYIIVMNLRNRRPCRGSGVQLQRPGLDPGPIDVKFVVIKVTLRQFLLPALHISPVHQCSTFVSIYSYQKDKPG